MIAVAFCYFETLLRIGDSTKFLEEEVRLTSLQNVLKDVGFQEHLYIDFVDGTLDLLRQLSRSSNGQDDLAEAFNDFVTSQGVITYFKVYNLAQHSMSSANFCSF